MSDHPVVVQDEGASATPEVKQAAVVGSGGELDPTIAKPLEFTNNNLIKFETHDKFSTVNAMKKYIAKVLKMKYEQGQEEPIFEGLTRMGKNPKSGIAFLAFSTEAQKDAARAVLLTMTYRGQAWSEMKVNQQDLALTHRKGQRTDKRNRDTDGDDQDSAVSKVCPLADMPYNEQLDKKRKHCQRVFNVVKAHQNQRGNLTKVPHDAFQGIIPSPVQDGYRNNVTLSCGVSKDGVKAIGFNAGSVLEGGGYIEPLNHIPVHPGVKAYADCVSLVSQALVTTGITGLEEVDVTSFYSKLTKGGFWRKVQVRNNVQGEFLLDIEFNVAEPTPEPVKQYIDGTIGPALVQAMSALPSGLCSLQYHCYDGVSNASTELVRYVMHGPASLTETLCGKEFDVSPTAFFQVNIPATELMMAKVAELARLTKDTILLDLCCGTGTIGICLASQVKSVIGVEMVPDAIKNAKMNAARNNIDNVTYHCGKVEEVLLPILQQLENQSLRPGAPPLDVVAILDPPRCGVHPDVVKWIRRNVVVNRMVYISCDQRSLERDSEGFVKPPTKTFFGAPFGVQAALGVDLFPHTDHQEMFAVFQRVVIPPLPTVVAVAPVAVPTGSTEAAAPAIEGDAVPSPV